LRKVALSADRVNALWYKRRTTTAYVLATGTLPADRMRKLETDDETVPPPSTVNPPTPPEVEMDRVHLRDDFPTLTTAPAGPERVAGNARSRPVYRLRLG
jgi:hypothetical protein